MGPHPAVRLVPRVLALFPLLLVLAPAGARAQAFDPGFWSVDGEGGASVFATTLRENRLYVGGAFEVAGAWTGCGVPVNLAGNVVPGFPRVRGTRVTVAASDGAGGCFIAGDFDSVGGLPRRHVAHVRADLSVGPWDPSPDGFVSSIVRFG